MDLISYLSLWQFIPQTAQAAEVAHLGKHKPPTTLPR